MISPALWERVDTRARHDWGWKPEYDLAAMTRDMLEKLTAKLRGAS